MTADNVPHSCENDLHYTCSTSNCNHEQQNMISVHGSLCLQKTSNYRVNEKQHTVVSRMLFSLIVAVLLVCATVFLTGCGRESGKFPNIPEVMDECGSWSEEEFASRMNLERNTKLTGGSEVAAPNWAKDLTPVVGNDDLVTMYLSGDSEIVSIWLGPDWSEVISYDTLNQAQAAMRSLIRYDFNYYDAIELLDLVGIKENSIKVYDDFSTEGNTLISQGSFYHEKQYKMCGEAETADGLPLYFALSAQAGYSYSSYAGGTEIEPVDSILMRFTTTKPFDLSEEL